MRVLTLSLVGVLAICLTTANATAAIIAETGFNSDAYTNGTEITDASEGTGEVGWTSGWIRPSNGGPANASDAFFSEGDMALHLHGTSSDHARIARDFTPTSARYVTQDVEARVSAFNGQTVSFYLRGDGGAQQATAVSILSDGSISIKDGDNAGGSSDLTIFPANTIQLDQWHSFSIATDLVTQKFTVSVDDTLATVNGGEYFFRTTSPANPIEFMDRAEFWSARNFDAHYDNLVISAVPEPSTIALLGMAGVLSFVAYRRK